MQSAPIQPANPTKPLPAGAIAAMGGEPIPMPALPGMEAPAVPQSAPTSVPAAPFLTGVPTFDPEPAEVTERRAKVAKAREGLRSAMAAVSAAHETILPILSDMKADAELLKKSEGFDVGAAIKLLTAMAAPVRELKYPKPAATAPQADAKPAAKPQQ